MRCSRLISLPRPTQKSFWNPSSTKIDLTNCTNSKTKEARTRFKAMQPKIKITNLKKTKLFVKQLRV